LWKNNILQQYLGETVMAYLKTEAGTNEIKTRALKLSGQLRNLLLMVDGFKTGAELEAIAQSLGAPAGALAELVQRGLIADGAITATRNMADDAEITAILNPLRAKEQEAERYTRLQQTMNDIVRSTMGLRGVFMTMKIEKCMNLADLKMLYPNFEAVVVKGAGEQIGKTLCYSVRKDLSL
jgi:DNA-binding FrmR family transcriptional regulator